jgi:hypothetical protein
MTHYDRTGAMLRKVLVNVRTVAPAAARRATWEPTGPGDQVWYPTALNLLVQAGANLDRAREIDEVSRRRAGGMVR